MEYRAMCQVSFAHVIYKFEGYFCLIYNKYMRRRPQHCQYLLHIDDIARFEGKKEVQQGWLIFL